jgi:ribosomal-protein-alanine N-acetyltransferase
VTIVRTQRLVLRPLRLEDVTETYVAWLNDMEVVRYLEVRYSPQDFTAVRDYVAATIARQSEHFYGIFLVDTLRHIGNIKVGPVHPLADISLVLGARDCWGKGYASEAIAAMSRHAFEQLGVRKLSAGMYSSNEASRRAFLKAGYLEEGRRRSHYLLDGKPCDVIQMGLLREDLEKKE